MEALGEALIPTYTIAIGILVTAFIILGFSRITFPRRSSFEGIEDPESAQAYDRISRWPQFRMLRRMIVGKLAKYQPKGILADIGCGPGYLTTLITQRHRHLHVVGFDTSYEMIRTATLNASTLDLSDRVEFREGDVSSLPMPEGTLDFAVSTLSLHHWSDPNQGLAEFHRVLKPGGQLLVFDLRRDSRRFFYWLLRFAQMCVVPAALRRINEPLGSLLSSYTAAEVENLFARSPFSDWRIEGGPAWVFAWAGKRPETT
jgi:ubiquinone/menaquinone biosynthesis C-methylase UbiE